MATTISKEEWDDYREGRIDLCHLCHDAMAVTSDGVCGACASAHPRDPLPPSEREQLCKARQRIAELEAAHDTLVRERAELTEQLAIKALGG